MLDKNILCLSKNIKKKQGEMEKLEIGEHKLNEMGALNMK